MNRFERHPRTTVAAIVVCGLVLALALLEAAARLLLPDVNFVGESAGLLEPRRFADSRGYRPNAQGTSWGAEVRTDGFGFRFDPTLGSRKGKPVLVLIGDSVTFGTGVEAARTFAGLLARDLAGYRVLNASGTGYAVHDYANIARTFVLPNRASLDIRRVLVMLSLNDILEWTTLTPRQKAAVAEERYTGLAGWVWRLNRPVRLNEYLFAHSKLYLLAKRSLFDGSRLWFFADTAAYRDETRIEALAWRLDELRASLVTEGIETDLVLLPYEYELRVESPETREPRRRLRAALDGQGVPYVDLLEPVRARASDKGLSSRDLFLFNDHCHLSRIGHEIVRDVLLPVLSGPSAAARGLAALAAGPPHEAQ